ncbi:MAG TPA: PLP-dependent aminotransferase family protein [Anaerolineae bacterium]|nr:PLP-dependent aminotransferase family protein [Anaerolineae bacterium]HQK15722.1 PLP-dependent aminotransferase family protein [Anaerolineae bacterium]
MTVYAVSENGQVNWERFLARRVQKMQSSAIRELLKITQQPDVISFGGGMPAPELFPVREIEEACSYLLRESPKMALQYSTTEGYRPLREFLAEAMAKYGIRHSPDNILITTGSQQALDLIGKIFLDPGTYVLAERPTYLGAIQAWRAYEADFVTVPLDDDGMQVEYVEDVLKQTPVRYIYVLPNFHNPAGTTFSEERRHTLVDIARKYDLIIVEDDPYGALRYTGEDIIPIAALAPERTIYLGTFSKTLAPGVRIGWVVAPAEIIHRLVQAKQGADLHSSTFDQMIANDVAQRGILKMHVRKLRKVYGERRDIMLEALAEFWPEGSSWTTPKGGLFLWARVPESINTLTFMPKALAKKVAYVPGVHFYPHEDGGFNAMRLNFSNAQPEMIVEGIRRLGEALKEELAHK